MARNRPVRVPRPRVIGRHGPQPSTYRYRTTDRNGETPYSRLQTVDLDLLRLERGARVNLLVASGERLPFADGSFDRVVCTEVLEHVPNDRLLVNEFVRVLRPGGTIAVRVPHTYAEAITWWLLALQRFRLEETLRIYRRRQVVDLLKAVGLQIYARRYRHSLESLRWLLIWMSVEDGGAVKSISDAWDDFLTDRTGVGYADVR